ncbi:MAG TPA: DUF2752 domain-containing protein [Phycisphaerae bacterium]|nr:DUF2752 domain-containing protein [Phycisphaerae bacterium]HRY67165.1 DUF2752 domain-containing protein [Phycisphaerae bacterium]HSA26466.1 DUF2752 domain-containing protein [Phycisphaerae bacterium]
MARPAKHPLGPLVVMAHVDSPVWGRVYAAGITAVAVAVLVVAARLTPDDSHMGTHRQMGLPPCGFVAITGLPCPTCGMTTAFVCVTHGQLRAALRAQVAGALLAIATAVVGVAAAFCMMTGRYPTLNWYRVDAARLVYWVALMLVAAWGLTIALGLLDGSLPVRWPEG